jgi:hypothetical protein
VKVKVVLDGWLGSTEAWVLSTDAWVVSTEAWVVSTEAWVVSTEGLGGAWLGALSAGEWTRARVRGRARLIARAH